MLKKIILLSMCCAILMLCGCGQSGALYLPKEGQAKNSQITAKEQTTNSQNENSIY